MNFLLHPRMFDNLDCLGTGISKTMELETSGGTARVLSPKIPKDEVIR